jgi:hypothetical protein
MQEPAHAREWTQLARLFPRMDPDLMWAALRDGDVLYKLWNPDGSGFKMQAFDLVADPAESLDVYDPARPDQREAAARLEGYKARLVAAYGRAEADAAARGVPSKETTDALRSLGYIR